MTNTPALMPPSPGAPAPPIVMELSGKMKVRLDQLAGRFLILGFTGPANSQSAEAIETAQAATDLFDGAERALFWIANDANDKARLKPLPARIGILWDDDLSISRSFGLSDTLAYCPAWVVLDPRYRVLFTAPLAETGAMLDFVSKLPAPSALDGGPPAPALIVPRVLEPEMCRRLIEVYQTSQPTEGGFMQQVNGKTVRVVDPSQKRRTDVVIGDVDLRLALRDRLSAHLIPEIFRAFQFEATRIERYVVSCYDAEVGGFFRPHRDDTSTGTAHRKFAVTLNLNAEDYEGGDLRFPEFGPQALRAPTGGAVVFSCSLLHEALPVTKGKRYAFLPFLYDEAGAAVREANLSTLADNVAKHEAL